jgi:hypothetical protein
MPFNNWTDALSWLNSQGVTGMAVMPYKERYWQSLASKYRGRVSPDLLEQKRKEFLDIGQSNILEALKGGWESGLAGSQHHLGNVLDIIGMDEKGEELRKAAAEKEEAAAARTNVDTFLEKVAAGLGSVPGAVASLAPYAAVAAPVIGAALEPTPLGEMAIAALASGGAFGLHGAVQSADKPLKEQLKETLLSAGTGAAFGLAGQIPKAAGVQDALKRRLLHAGGTAAAMGAPAAATGQPLQDVLAAATTGAVLGIGSKGAKTKIDVLKKRWPLLDEKTLGDAIKEVEKSPTVYKSYMEKAKGDHVAAVKMRLRDIATQEETGLAVEGASAPATTVNPKRGGATVEATYSRDKVFEDLVGLHVQQTMFDPFQQAKKYGMSNEEFHKLNVQARKAADQILQEKGVINKPEVDQDEPFEPMTFNTPHGEKVVRFNRKDPAIGAVPAQGTMKGEGAWTAAMTPAEFWALARELYPENPELAGRLRPKSVKYLQEALERGEEIAPPWLRVEVRHDEAGKPYWKVLGHEGRHRMAAIAAHIGDPNKPMPVDIFPTGEARYRIQEALEGGRKAPFNRRSINIKTERYADELGSEYQLKPWAWAKERLERERSPIEIDELYEPAAPIEPNTQASSFRLNRIGGPMLEGTEPPVDPSLVQRLFPQRYDYGKSARGTVEKVFNLFGVPYTSKGLPKGKAPDGTEYDVSGRYTGPQPRPVPEAMLRKITAGTMYARMKNLSSVGTAVHESMHAVTRERLPGILDRVRREAFDEAVTEFNSTRPENLRWTVGAEKNPKPDTVAAEATAQVMTRSVFSGEYSEATQRIARIIEEEIGKRPEVGEMLGQAREAVEGWRKQSPLEEAMAGQALEYKNDLSALRHPINWFKEKWVNSTNPIVKMYRDLQRAGFSIDVIDDARLLMLERQAAPAMARWATEHGIEHGIFDLIRTSEHPIAKGAREMLEVGGIDDKNYLRFATVLRALTELEWRKQGRRVESPMSDAEGALRQHAEQFPAEHAKFLDAAKMYTKYGEALVDLGIKNGLWAEKARAELLSNEHWSSLMREVEQPNRPSKAVEHLEGASGQRYADPFMSLLYHTEIMFNHLSHNRLMQGMARTMKKFQGFQDPLIKAEGIGQTEPIKTGALWRELNRQVEFRTGEKKVIQKRYEDSRNAITYRENGEYVTVELAPELYRAIKHGENWRLPQFLDFFAGGPKRMATLGYTGLNVGFQLITNPIRDLWIRGLQTPQNPLKVMEDVLTAKTPIEMAKQGPLYRRAMASGIQISSQVGGDIRSAAAFRDKILAGRSGTGLLKYVVRHPIEGMRELFSFSEMLNRMSEFEAAELEHGVGTPEAYLRGREAAADITLNFRRMGQYGRIMNEMIPFFNAGIQGIDKFGRSLDPREVGANQAMANAMKGLASVTMPSLILWNMHKDEQWYQELPAWEKSVFLHFKVGEKIMRLPMPFEWGLMFGSLPVAALDSHYQGAPEKMKASMKQAASVLFPAWLPQALQPTVESLFNYDIFKGRPIVSKGLQRRLPEDQYRAHTPEFYKEMGKLMNVSPLKLQHMIEGYTGGLTREPTAMLDLLKGKAEWQAERMPVFHRLFTKTDMPGQSVADFYSKLNRAQQVWESVKSRAAEGDKEGARKLLRQNLDTLGLKEWHVDRLVRSRKPSSPPRLRELTRVARKMAELRKRDENEEMTLLARKALGR